MIGDVVFFDQFLVDVQKGVHDLENDSLLLAFITNAVTPLETTADPHWGGTGTTDLSTNEVTGTGNYSAGGVALVNPTVTLVGGAGKFDAADVEILVDALNPTDARWGILVNDTSTGKKAIGFVDLGSDTDLTAGDFNLGWHEDGISSMNQAA